MPSGGAHHSPRSMHAAQLERNCVLILYANQQLGTISRQKVPLSKDCHPKVMLAFSCVVDVKVTRVPSFSSNNGVISTAAFIDISRLCHSGLHHGFAQLTTWRSVGRPFTGL